MRTSRYLLATTRETPADAVVVSHQLMQKAPTCFLLRPVSSAIEVNIAVLVYLSEIAADFLAEDFVPAIFGSLVCCVKVVKCYCFQSAFFWLLPVASACD